MYLCIFCERPIEQDPDSGEWRHQPSGGAPCDGGESNAAPDRCDECGVVIPHNAYAELNTHHAGSCSLHPDNAVETDPPTVDAPPATRLSSLRTPARVRVFHNSSREALFAGFQAGHAVTEVFTYTATRPAPDGGDEDLLSDAWHVFNVGDDPAFGPPDQRALDYRRCGNRSLSVGDVVAVDNRFYACATVAWRALDTAPRVQQRRAHGTTPLPPAPLMPVLGRLAPILLCVARWLRPLVRRGRHGASAGR